MKKFFTLSLLMMATFAINALGQDLSIDIFSYCGNTYEGYTYTFTEAELAQVQNTIGCSIADASAFAVQSDGTEDSEYGLGSTDGWRNADGDWLSWSDGPNFCVKADFTAESEQFYYIGGYGTTTEPVSYTATYKLYNPDDNTKSMKLLLNFIYKNPESVLLADMEIVGTAEFEISQNVTGDDYYEYYSLKIADLAEKLGVSTDDLKNKMEQMILGKEVSTDDTTSGAFAGVLTGYINGDCGFCFTQFYDENTDTDLPECGVSDQNNVIWVDELAYDGENLTFALGQFKNACQTNSQYYAYIYIYSGTKAYQIKFTLNTGDLVAITLDDYTKVGGQTIDLVFNTADLPAMEKRAIEIDMEAIAKCFGEDVTVSDLALANDVFADLMSIETRIPNFDLSCSNGFYMDWVGNHETWGTGSDYVKVGYAPDKGVLQFAYVYSDAAAGNTFTGSTYIIYNGMYYEFKFNIRLTDEQLVPIEECELAAQLSFDVRLVVTGHSVTENYTDYTNIVTYLDKELIEKYLGTTAPSLFGQIKDSETGDITWTNDPETWDVNTSGNTNGFWADAENDGLFVAASSSTAKVGFAYGRCMVEWWNNSSNLAEIGETTHARFFLANLEAGKMIEFTANITFIDPDDYKDTSLVGSEALVVEGNSDEAETKVENIEDIYALLGCTAEEFASLGNVKAPIGASSYVGMESIYYDEMYYGYALDENGYVLDGADPDQCDGIVMYVGFSEGSIFVTTMEDLDDETTYKTKLALEYNSKRYIFELTICKDPSVGVAKVQINKADNAATYNLAGQKVDGSYKGIVIKSGQKYLAK